MNLGEKEYVFGDKVFRCGDRVQLDDREPVYSQYRGLVGTVVGEDGTGFLRVSYDGLGSRVLSSDPDTLTIIHDEFDMTDLNNFIENQ